MTRAFIHLLRGEIVAAFILHPLFWLLPAAGAYQLYLLKKGLRISLKLWITAAAILFIIYGARMNMLFPHREPMTLYPKPLILKLLPTKVYAD